MKKFYTEDGNWDLVGNNTPIFFIRDPILFPSFIHTQKRNPATHCKDPDAFWDFISLRPETTHQVAFLFSDRGTPDGYRHMNGYGSHTFKTVNEAGEAFFVKWHFKTDQGIKNLTAAAADQLASSDPDYATRDLYNAIDTANYPSWTAYFQVMTLDQAARVAYDPFDVTKVWPHTEFPIHEVGRLVLDRNPTNQLLRRGGASSWPAFAPSFLPSFPHGAFPACIEPPSPDKMLAPSTPVFLSYSDTHRHRLGVNYQQIPVNCPYAAQHGVRNYQRDGGMQVNGNQASAPNYFPNSFSGPAPATPRDAAWHTEPVGRSASEVVARYETGGKDHDNFTQCGQFYRKVLTAPERDRLADNIAGNLFNAQEFLQTRAIGNFAAADANFGQALKQKVEALRKKKKQAEKAPKSCPVAKLSPMRAAPVVDGKRSNL